MANRSSNTTAVPEAKSALDRFKTEVAGVLGVPLTDGYNGNLTSRQNGSVGGYMVKKNDRSTGTADVRTEQHGQPERHERLPDVSLAGKRGKKTGSGEVFSAPGFFVFYSSTLPVTSPFTT